MLVVIEFRSGLRCSKQVRIPRVAKPVLGKKPARSERKPEIVTLTHKRPKKSAGPNNTNYERPGGAQGQANTLAGRSRNSIRTDQRI